MMEPIKEKTGDAYRHDLRELYEKGSSKQWVFDEELFNFSNGLLNEPAGVPKLYRYSPADYWNIRNLETGQLRLTPLSELNDVQEGLPAQEQASTEPASDFGFVKCFSECGAEPLMWGHYGDRSKGVCVEYDITRLPEEQRNILYYLFPVIYTAQRYPYVNNQYAQEDLKRYRLESADLTNCIVAEDYFFLQDILPLLLVKGQEWDYEKEWRVAIDILSLEQRCDDIKEQFGQRLPHIEEGNLVAFDCVSAVYMGIRMEEAVRRHIRDIVKSLNVTRYKKRPPIRLYEMKYAKDTFQLKPNEISI